MKTHNRHRTLFALSVVVMSICAGVCHADDRPNSLVILADDLGYADLGFTGSKEIKTPVLDNLAGNGVVFENGYVTTHTSGLQGLVLMTGRYQARFGMEVNLTNSPFDTHNGLPLTERTFADQLQKAGCRQLLDEYRKTW